MKTANFKSSNDFLQVVREEGVEFNGSKDNGLRWRPTWHLSCFLQVFTIASQEATFVLNLVTLEPKLGPEALRGPFRR